MTRSTEPIAPILKLHLELRVGDAREPGEGYRARRAFPAALSLVLRVHGREHLRRDLRGFLSRGLLRDLQHDPRAARFALDCVARDVGPAPARARHRGHRGGLGEPCAGLEGREPALEVFAVPGTALARDRGGLPRAGRFAPRCFPGSRSLLGERPVGTEVEEGAEGGAEALGWVRHLERATHL